MLLISTMQYKIGCMMSAFHKVLIHCICVIEFIIND